MSGGERDLVVATVREILAGHPPSALTPERPWDPRLWAALVDTGLTGVGLPEAAGGSGGDLGDAVAIVATLAAGAGAVPLAEHLLVAGPAWLAAGLPLPAADEPWTVALDATATVTRGAGGWVLSGAAAGVPWAGVARHLAVLGRGPRGPVLCVAPGSAGTVTPGWDLAGQPRGSVRWDAVVVSGEELTEPAAEELRARYALARSIQLSAALQEILAWTVQYAGQREQFGRPIAAFQAVQTELAEMAGEVTAVAAVVDAAVQVLHRGGNVVAATAAAKVRAGAAVQVVAARAHQVHGAIGFTQEYRLHHLTRRCWSWRDDAGNESSWSRVLGTHLLADADGLWPALTRVL